MQEAHVSGWTREAHVPVGMLESLCDLNHRFLDLIADQPREWLDSNRGLPLAVAARFAPLSAAQKAAAAGCPYALFDLRFHDERHWQSRLLQAGRWSVADSESGDPRVLEFMRTAMFFAWHVAVTARIAAQLLFGMHEVTAIALRRVTIQSVPALALTEAVNLTARWNSCAPYWNALAGAALRANEQKLRKVQLYGLQLAAASHLN